MKFYQNTIYQSDKVLLIEFINTDLYKNHYVSLFSFCSAMSYDLFENLLYYNNKKIVENIRSLHFKNIDSISIIAPIKKFPDSPWIIPWIEFVDDEFLCTLSWDTKKEDDKTKTILTKSVYFFIEHKKNEQFFLKFTENTALFYESDGIKIPLTLRFLTGIDCFILKLEIHQYEFDFKNLHKKELDDYNFVYFCNALKSFWDTIEIEEKKTEISGEKFIDLFKTIIKRQIPTINC